MKRSRNIAFFLFFLTIFGSGLYGMSFTTRGGQCDCYYPNSDEYGRRAPANPQNTEETCVILNCWIPLR